MPKMTSDEKAAKAGEALYKHWQGQITDALEREKTYRKQGKVSVDLYEIKDPENTPFNILYSNVEVLQPATYNAKPIPIVQRRYKDADPAGKAVSDVSTRLLKYLIDTESESYDGFDELMQAVVLDGFVTNRGIMRFKYVPKDGHMAECVYGEAVRWDKFFHGYARTWKKVPWIGFEWDMTKDELQKNFPRIQFDFQAYRSTAEESDNREENRQELKGVTLYKVYEIWDKRDKKVRFFCPAYPKGPVRETDDPLRLMGFFPIARPLNFMKKITTLVPTPLYEQYQSQARELNDITRRLKAIVKAAKVRGAYNSAVEGIEKILTAEDNEVVPVENMQSMPDNTGLDKILFLMPIDMLIQSAQALFQARESCKQVIYEITGISDILRGASVASETATAQQLKNQWGSLRLKKMQKEVQRYVRECLAIMLEISGKAFDLDTIMAMTGAPYLTNDQKQTIELAQSAVPQMGHNGGPPMGPEGVPPLPPQEPMGGPPPPMPMAPEPQLPPLPPEILNALNQPSWEDIHAILKDSLLMHYKVDIETNSTIDAEAAQDKEDIAELLNALSQFLNGLGPLVESGTMPFEIAQQMLLVISRRYTFGSQLEDAIMAMKAPQPQADPADQTKLEVEKIKAQATIEKQKQDMQLAQMEFEHKKQLMQLQVQLDLAELEIKKQELQLQERAMGMKLQAQTIQHQQKLEQIQLQKTAPAGGSTGPDKKEPANANV